MYLMILDRFGSKQKVSVVAKALNRKDLPQKFRNFNLFLYLF